MVHCSQCYDRVKISRGLCHQLALVRLAREMEEMADEVDNVEESNGEIEEKGAMLKVLDLPNKSLLCLSFRDAMLDKTTRLEFGNGIVGVVAEKVLGDMNAHLTMNAKPAKCVLRTSWKAVKATTKSTALGVTLEFRRRRGECNIPLEAYCEAFEHARDAEGFFLTFKKDEERTCPCDIDGTSCTFAQPTETFRVSLTFANDQVFRRTC